MHKIKYSTDFASGEVAYFAGWVWTYLGLGDLVSNGQDTGNVLAHLLDLSKLGRGTASHLSNAQGGELGLKLAKLRDQLGLGLLA